MLPPIPSDRELVGEINHARSRLGVLTKHRGDAAELDATRTRLRVARFRRAALLGLADAGEIPDEARIAIALELAPELAPNRAAAS